MGDIQNRGLHKSDTWIIAKGGLNRWGKEGKHHSKTQSRLSLDPSPVLLTQRLNTKDERYSTFTVIK